MEEWEGWGPAATPTVRRLLCGPMQMGRRPVPASLRQFQFVGTDAASAALSTGVSSLRRTCGDNSVSRARFLAALRSRSIRKPHPLQEYTRSDKRSLALTAPQSEQILLEG